MSFLYPAALVASVAAAGYQFYESSRRYLRQDETIVQLAHIDARELDDRTYWENWFLDHPNVPRHLRPRRPLRLLSLGEGNL